MSAYAEVCEAVIVMKSFMRLLILSLLFVGTASPIFFALSRGTTKNVNVHRRVSKCRQKSVLATIHAVVECEQMSRIMIAGHPM